MPRTITSSILATFFLFIIIFDVRDVHAAITVPVAKKSYEYTFISSAVVDSDPSRAKPLGVGSVALGGSTLSINVAFDQFAGKVDIYGAYTLSSQPGQVNILNAGGASFGTFPVSAIVSALASGVPPAGAGPWMSGTLGPLNYQLFTIPLTSLPTGVYTVYILVTPEGSLGSYYLWKTRFSVFMNNVVFVTSITGNGNLGSWSEAGSFTGLAAADAVCMARARAAGMSGTFVSLVSDETTDFYCRLHGFAGKKSDNCGQTILPVSAGPWVRTDGFPFGPSAVELFNNGAVYTPVRYNEFGLPVPQGQIYWSRTLGDGALHWAGGETCANWTSSSSELGGNGDSDGTTETWASGGGIACSADISLLCMQAGTGKALPGLISTGKTVFLTSVSGSGNLNSWADAGGAGGLSTGDAICRARAQEAGLVMHQSFKAWLSDSTTNAIDRLTHNGPWVRPDGVVIAVDKSDLTDGEIFTAISMDESGSYWGNYGVWTGTDDSGIKTSNTCNGWTDATSTGSGTGGRSSWAGIGWSHDMFPSACDSTWLHLYCFED